MPAKKRALVFGGAALAFMSIAMSPKVYVGQSSTVEKATQIISDKPINVGSMDISATASVRIPVAGFSQPLMFNGAAGKVEPTARLAGTASLTLVPRLGPNKKPLPIMAAGEDDSVTVNRNNLNVVATLANYKQLASACTPDITRDLFCVGAFPKKMEASGIVTQDIADKLNSLLLPTGKYFPTYHAGVKAKMARAITGEVTTNTCGQEIEILADSVIKNLIKKQFGKDKVKFSGDRYPVVSPNYDDKFQELNKIAGFTIERGDAANNIPNSLQVQCTVTPKNSKDNSKGI